MLRTKLGLEKTGIFGFWFEISCLTLPLISIWLPGSPFDPGYMQSGRHVTATNGCVGNSTGHVIDTYDVIVNNSESSVTGSTIPNFTITDKPCAAVSTVTPSIVVFMIGVILSRIGEYYPGSS